LEGVMNTILLLALVVPTAGEQWSSNPARDEQLMLELKKPL
jgi:hypothetical protein